MIDSIEHLIPQKQPFVFINNILEEDEATITTQFTIPESGPLVKNSLASEALFLENIAQSAAAKAGISFSKKHEAIPIGYIGGVKKFEVFDVANAGDLITTTVTFVNEVLNASIVEGKIYLKDQLIAQCELKIFIQA